MKEKVSETSKLEDGYHCTFPFLNGVNLLMVVGDADEQWQAVVGNTDYVQFHVFLNKADYLREDRDSEYELLTDFVTGVRQAIIENLIGMKVLQCSECGEGAGSTETPKHVH